MRIYRYFHYLGFDIVLGALASSCFAARLFETSPGFVWWITLALTVWLLYTGDHMLDAWRHRKKVRREMHIFLLRHRRLVIYSLGVVAVVNSMLIINLLEKQVFKYALILAGLVLLFYAMRHVFRKNRFLFVPGEFFVLLFYLAGTWLGPAAKVEGGFVTSQGLIALIFGGVLLMNLGVISLYDLKLDSRMGISSLASMLGKQRTRNLLIGTGVSILVLTVLQFMVFEADRYTQFALILCGMATILLLVVYLPSRFRNKDLYRWTADAVLFMGFLSLLIRG
jgi:branched-subunit amino acid transport protein